MFLFFLFLFCLSSFFSIFIYLFILFLVGTHDLRTRWSPPVFLNLIHVLVFLKNFYLFYEGTDDDGWQDEWMERTTGHHRKQTKPRILYK